MYNSLIVETGKKQFQTFDGQILGSSQKAQSIGFLEAFVRPTIDYAVCSFILTISNILS